MKQDKKTDSVDSQNDDVGRLFDKLGSAGAGLYQDFEPNRLPNARPSVQGVPTPAVEPAVPPPLAAVRALRPEPVAVVMATVPAMASPTAVPSPLGELFNRLLQVETAPPPSGVLKRMFGR